MSTKRKQNKPQKLLDTIKLISIKKSSSQQQQSSFAKSINNDEDDESGSNLNNKMTTMISICNNTSAGCSGGGLSIHPLGKIENSHSNNNATSTTTTTTTTSNNNNKDLSLISSDDDKSIDDKSSNKENTLNEDEEKEDDDDTNSAVAHNEDGTEEEEDNNGAKDDDNYDLSDGLNEGEQLDQTCPLQSSTLVRSDNIDDAKKQPQQPRADLIETQSHLSKRAIGHDDNDDDCSSINESKFDSNGVAGDDDVTLTSGLSSPTAPTDERAKSTPSSRMQQSTTIKLSASPRRATSSSMSPSVSLSKTPDARKSKQVVTTSSNNNNKTTNDSKTHTTSPAAHHAHPPPPTSHNRTSPSTPSSPQQQSITSKSTKSSPGTTNGDLNKSLSSATSEALEDYYISSKKSTKTSLATSSSSSSSSSSPPPPLSSSTCSTASSSNPSSLTTTTTSSAFVSDSANNINLLNKYKLAQSFENMVMANLAPYFMPSGSAAKNSHVPPESDLKKYNENVSSIISSPFFNFAEFASLSRSAPMPMVPPLPFHPFPPLMAPFPPHLDKYKDYYQMYADKSQEGLRADESKSNQHDKLVPFPPAAPPPLPHYSGASVEYFNYLLKSQPAGSQMNPTIFNEFFYNSFYKSPNGYPDFTNEIMRNNVRDLAKPKPSSSSSSPALDASKSNSSFSPSNIIKKKKPGTEDMFCSCGLGFESLETLIIHLKQTNHKAKSIDLRPGSKEAPPLGSSAPISSSSQLQLPTNLASRKRPNDLKDISSPNKLPHVMPPSTQSASSSSSTSFMLPSPPTKMVRGQEEWVNNSRNNNFISQILKCMECSASFNTLADLSVHMLNSNHFSKFHPNGLGSSSSHSSPYSSNSSSLSSHVSHHASAFNSTKKPAGSPFSSSNSKPGFQPSLARPTPVHALSNQTPSQHQSAQKQGKNANGQAPMSCPICKKMFDSSTSQVSSLPPLVELIQHLQKTHGITHICTNCGAYFETPEALQRHLVEENFHKHHHHTQGHPSSGLVSSANNMTKMGNMEMLKNAKALNGFAGPSRPPSEGSSMSARKSESHSEGSSSKNTSVSSESSSSSNSASLNGSNPLLALQMLVNGSQPAPLQPTPASSVSPRLLSSYSSHESGESSKFSPGPKLPAKKRPYVEDEQDEPSGSEKMARSSSETDSSDKVHNLHNAGAKRVLNSVSPFSTCSSSMGSEDLSSAGDSTKQAPPSKQRSDSMSDKKPLSSASSSSLAKSSSPHSFSNHLGKSPSSESSGSPSPSASSEAAAASAASASSNQTSIYNQNRSHFNNHPLHLLQNMHLHLDDYLLR